MMAKVLPEDQKNHSNGCSEDNDTEQIQEFDDEAVFIKSRIKYRKCKTYVARHNQKGMPKDERLCHCNYPKKEHPKYVLEHRSKRQTTWTVAADTETFPTNAFGEIEFVGFGDRIGKYVRVDQKQEEMDIMLDLLSKIWKMEMPNLLISVTGGAKNFTMKARLKEVFRRGLVKAAQSTGAWIVTGGTNAGVMKHVGEAVRDFGLTSEGRVTTIGIATWGCIQNKEILIGENVSKPVPYRIDSEAKAKQSILDPNHTHFILVDDGTQHQFAVEIPFRARLEEAISKKKTKSGTDAISVPVCLLVLEGGPGTLETVYSAIKMSTPTVVIKGSGKTADILAYAYQNTKEEEITKDDLSGNSVKKLMEPQVEAKVRDMLQAAFGDSDSENFEKRVKWVEECCVNRDLLSVFELDSKNSAKDVDLAILKALLKANKHQVINQLKLALAWNRIDVAKSEIFTDERTWPTGMLDDVMMSAIKLNRVDFVELFLDNGVSLKNFFNMDRLITLYNTIPSHCLLHTLLVKTKKKHDNVDSTKEGFTLKHVGHLLQDLLGDFFLPHYLTQTEIDQKSNVNPAQELFIWAVLMNHLKLSKLFWREGKQSSTAACLFAYSVLKSLKAHTMDAKAIRKLQIAADDYLDLVIGVISNCYSSDEARTHDVLIQYLPNWGQTTCVQLAVKSDNQLFISQNACQSLLTKVWMGKISQVNSLYKIFVCIFLFPLVHCWITFNAQADRPRRLPQATSEKTKGKKELASNGHALKTAKPSVNATTEQSKNKEVKVKQNNLKKKYQKWKCFYTSPIVKFIMNVLMYLLFLVLYSYILVVQLSPQFHWLEGILIAWVFSLSMEELRECLTGSATSKLKTYFNNRWNYLDVTCIVLFILGIGLRFADDEGLLMAARVILSINLITFFSRILHIFSINKQLGPKLVMIGRMLQDLKWFVVIMLVFIVSYALASEAVLYPNSEPSWALLYHVPRKAYWHVYGELFLDEIENTSKCGDCIENRTSYGVCEQKRCPTEVGRYFVPILLGFYMLMTNVLLLNLLIAMFSYTFEQIQENTDTHWCFQRFKLVLEYTERPALPPPFILLSLVYLLISHFRDSRSQSKTVLKPFNKVFKDKEEEKQLMQWEDLIADNFLDSKKKSDRNTMEGKVKATLERLDQLLSKVDEIQESQGQTPSIQPPGLAGNSESFSSTGLVERRVDVLEKQLTHTTKALEWIMTSLQEHNLASKQQQKPTLPDFKKR